MDGIKKFFENISPTAKVLIFGTVAVLLVFTIVLVVSSGSGKVTNSIELSLKEVIVNSQLRTAEYDYASIVEVKEDKGDNVKYYVSYKGTVFAGTDFEKVEIKRIGKTIRVVVPEVTILETTVDPELDYIFNKEKYKTETVYVEAIEICKKDLRKKAEANATLRKMAKESAEDTLKALLKPFESQLAEGETFEIVFDAEQGDDK